MPKIAIVHDHLLEFGGAERVLVALKRALPDADVYTSMVNYDRLGEHADEIRAWKVTSSWADRVPGFKRLFSPLRFLWPLIWESFDFRQYDVVISSSGTMMCKGIITLPKTNHLCYLHHPPRNLYGYETAIDWQRYWPVRIYGSLVNHQLLQWDYLSSQRVGSFLANSEETKRRIAKYYRRDAEVVYPPVAFPPEMPTRSSNPEYYLTVSRIARAKHIEVLVNAANKDGFRLKVVGSGRELPMLKEIAGPTVSFHEDVSDKAFDELFAGAKAFLFAARDEEFGIAPVEAMGRGVPVIAYASGGLKETVPDGETGFLYDELSPESLSKAVQQFEALSATERETMNQKARTHAQQYSFDRFAKQIRTYAGVTRG